MKRGFATIWDGIQYRQVSHEEAEKLEKEDKCQNLSGRIHSATELKFRREFTGYKTREIRAQNQKQDVEVEADPKDWMKYKKEASEFLGKSWNKTTKADTLAYMENGLGSQKV